MDRYCFVDQTRRDDKVGHSKVLFPDVQRMAVIAGMLAKRLAVVAKNYENCLEIEPALPQSFDQLTQGRIAVIEGVAIAIPEIAIGKGAGIRRRIGVMTGDGQIGQEEWLIRRPLVDPSQHAADGRWLVNAEA